MDDDALRQLLELGMITLHPKTIWGRRTITIRETGQVQGYCSHSFGIRKPDGNHEHGMPSLDHVLAQYLTLTYAPDKWKGNPTHHGY